MKTFDENIDAGAALLSQTLELVQEQANNSRTMAQQFANYHGPHHNKTHSSETQETVESQQPMNSKMQGSHTMINTGSSKSYIMPGSGSVAGGSVSIPQKKRQISNGSQISQQLQLAAAAVHENNQSQPSRMNTQNSL